MTYWRMQLHPSESNRAMQHAVESLASGCIGLDFRDDPGDLETVGQDSLPSNQKDYWAFAHEMQVGDKVLVVVHHFPFAVVTVKGTYNYIKERVPELGVWFRHFRRVEDPIFYGDEKTDVRKWEQITMIDTISPLREVSTKSYQLIDELLA